MWNGVESSLSGGQMMFHFATPGLHHPLTKIIMLHALTVMLLSISS